MSGTIISNEFIDIYMPKAHALYSVVYLLCLRYSSQPEFDTHEISKALNILESEVIHALSYWEEQEVIELTKRDGKIIQLTSLLDTNEKATPNESLKLKEPAAQRKNYTVDEISNQKENDDEVKYLFLIAEKLLAKPLAYNDMDVLLSFYSFYKLPIDVIETLLDYCIANNHKSLRYIEKVAIDWTDNDIQTAAEAQDYIALFNGDYREIMRSYGHTRRDPNPKEIAYMKKWLKKYKLPMDIIKDACDKTIMQTGQPKFAYTDKILTDWYEKEVKTLEDINSIETDFRKSKENKIIIKTSNQKNSTKKSNNKFNNFEGREWDYAAIEKMEQEYIKKQLGITE